MDYREFCFHESYASGLNQFLVITALNRNPIP